MSVWLHPIEIITIWTFSLYSWTWHTYTGGIGLCKNQIEWIRKYANHIEFLYHFSYSIEYTVDNFFSYCVVTPGIVVGRIFLSCNELVWMEQLSVSSCFHFIWINTIETTFYEIGSVTEIFYFYSVLSLTKHWLFDSTQE